MVSCLLSKCWITDVEHRTQFSREATMRRWQQSEDCSCSSWNPSQWQKPHSLTASLHLSAMSVRWWERFAVWRDSKHNRLPKGETEVGWWQKASSAAHRMLQFTHTEQQSCYKIRAQLCSFKYTTIKWQQTQMFSLHHLHLMSAALLEHACYFASRSCSSSAEQAGCGTKHW